MHSDVGGRRKDEGMQVPLKDFRGLHHLYGIGLGNPLEYVASAKSARSLATHRRTDSVVMLDARCIPVGRQAQVSIGLIEPGNGTVLAALLSLKSANGSKDTMLAEQATILTATSPWVYTQVLTFSPI